MSVTNNGSSSWLRHCNGIAVAVAALALSSSLAAQPVPAPGGAACNTATTPFCNALMPPPPAWKGHVFQLAQNYPATVPADAQPWLKFDPKTQPDQYIKAVLGYFFEGNIREDTAASFDPALNKVRGWYGAPWQDVGLNGREFIHGLTRERVSLPGELDPKQTKKWNNYAVGYYNAPGGMAIGKIWTNHGKPNIDLGDMPVGTVAAKLLFTTAPVTEAPFLAGSPEWDAYIYENTNNPTPKISDKRAVLKVRLLQIDVAVRDSRVDALTGWLFGTFVYGGGPGGPAGSGWTNVAPVGLMWGNDPGYSGTGPLKETYLNPNVHMQHVGYQGRLNGPVDNPVSSCLSCHGTAEVPTGVMIAPTTGDPRWFQNIRSGTPFDVGRKSTYYSLQVSLGIANFKAAQPLLLSPGSPEHQAAKKRLENPDPRPPRDGGPVH